MNPTSEAGGHAPADARSDAPEAQGAPIAILPPAAEEPVVTLLPGATASGPVTTSETAAPPSEAVAPAAPSETVAPVAPSETVAPASATADEIIAAASKTAGEIIAAASKTVAPAAASEPIVSPTAMGPETATDRPVARPVTSAVLKAAAQTPGDVREIVEGERRRRAAAASRASKGPPASGPKKTPPTKTARPAPIVPAKAKAATPAKPGVAPVAPAKLPASPAKPGPAPIASGPAPVAPAKAAAATATVATPPGPAAARATSAPAAAPKAPAGPAAARPAPRLAPASARAQTVVLPAPRVAVRARVWPIVLSIVAAGGLTAGGLVIGARLLADALAAPGATTPWGAPPVVTPGLTSPGAPAGDPGPRPTPREPDAGPGTLPSSGQLAPIGGGRVVYTTSEGHLVVLLPDPISGELTVERVYAVTRDAERHLGDAAQRRLHGYYLDDLEEARARSLAEARARHARRVAQAAAMPADLGEAEAASDEVVRLGGADALVADLDLAGTSAEVAVRRRCAALALGEAGYRRAIPGLLALLEGNGGPFAARVTRALSALTGLALDPEDPPRVAARVRAWLETHPLEGPFERVPPR